VLAKLKKLDWTIVVILLCFMVISYMMIYSSTVDDPKYSKFHLEKLNLRYYILGFICLFGVAMINYRIWLKTSVYAYIVGIVLLVALFKFGVNREGAVGWFSFGGLDFQPAELMKLILILTLAAFLSRLNGEKMELFRHVIPVGVIVAVPFLLVVMQPDLGNAIIFIVILLGMYWIGNIKFIHMLLGTVIVAGLLSGFVYSWKHYDKPIKTFMSDAGVGHWSGRIDTFLNPTTASKKDKYQAENSRIAIGSGYLTGDGYLQGTSVHNNFIPVAYTDAIFVTVGEEFGFIGVSVLLILYFLLIYRMILISMETDHLGGSYAIVGIVSLYVFQIFENVGMLIGLMPLTGITLPFVSYGGTSLLINMVALGIVLSIRMHQTQETEY
jgi:rod shape determining protein RodA